MIPRDLWEKLRYLDIAPATRTAIYEAAWDINRGRWDTNVYELAVAIERRCCESGKLTLDELIKRMREKDGR